MNGWYLSAHEQREIERRQGSERGTGCDMAVILAPKHGGDGRDADRRTEAEPSNARSR